MIIWELQHNADVLQQIQGIWPGAGTARGEQSRTTTDASDPASAVAEGHDRPAASSSLSVQSDTNIRQQGSSSTADDEDRINKETVPTALLSDRPMVSNSPATRSDIDVHQQGNRTVAGDQERLDGETEVTASPGDHPMVANSLSDQHDADVLQQVQGIWPGAGTVRDEQSRTTTDASVSADAVAEGHDRPGALGSLCVQSDTDIRRQGSSSTADEDRHDKETVPTALLSDRPMVSNSPSARSDIGVHQQGNRTVSGDQERLKEETAVAALPGDHPMVADSFWALNTTLMSSSRFKESSQPLEQVSLMGKLTPPQTSQIPPTQLRRGMTVLAHQVAQMFKATPIYASKEAVRLQVNRTSLIGRLQPWHHPVIALR